jgi:hypothetical protein
MGILAAPSGLNTPSLSTISQPASDAEIYSRQLLLKKHGCPLWCPAPYGNSAIYQTKGVRIGDVGYATKDGAFESLFNIRASRDDPINGQGVPDGFEQITLGLWDITHIPYFHKHDGVVMSRSGIKTLRTNPSANQYVHHRIRDTRHIYMFPYKLWVSFHMAHI